MQEQQHKSRNPPAPPLRQGSSLSYSGNTIRNSNTSSAANDTSSISSQSQLRGHDEESFNNDQVRVFDAVEGTPLNFSAATSFSDLTVDDVCPNDGRVVRDPDDGLLQLSSNRTFHGLDDRDTER